MPGLTLGASTVPDAAFVVHELPDGVAGILVELDTRTPSWRAALDRAVRESGGRPLDVRIVADDAAAVREAVEAAAAAGPVARVGAFAGRGHVTEPDLWAALTDAAARSLPDAELLGGARSHFTELNRRHGDLPHDLPSLAFSMTPQMHATERAQLVESIAMQAVVVRDAARIAAGRPLHVGPITLRSRFNAVATSAASGQADPTLADGYGAQLVAGATDARQSSAALAAWTVASFAAVATADVGDGGLVADVSLLRDRRAARHPERLGGLPGRTGRGAARLARRRPPARPARGLRPTGCGRSAAPAPTARGESSSRASPTDPCGSPCGTADAPSNAPWRPTRWP